MDQACVFLYRVVLEVCGSTVECVDQFLPRYRPLGRGRLVGVSLLHRRTRSLHLRASRANCSRPRKLFCYRGTEVTITLCTPYNFRLLR